MPPKSPAASQTLTEYPRSRNWSSAYRPENPPPITRMSKVSVATVSVGAAVDVVVMSSPDWVLAGRRSARNVSGTYGAGTGAKCPTLSHRSRRAARALGNTGVGGSRCFISSHRRSTSGLGQRRGGMTLITMSRYRTTNPRHRRVVADFSDPDRRGVGTARPGRRRGVPVVAYDHSGGAGRHSRACRRTVRGARRAPGPDDHPGDGQADHRCPRRDQDRYRDLPVLRHRGPPRRCCPSRSRCAAPAARTSAASRWASCSV